MLSQKSQVSPAPPSPAAQANNGSSGQLVEMPQASAVDVGVVEDGNANSVANAVAKDGGGGTGKAAIPRARPTKAMVENKLFDLLRDGFTLMSIEDTDSRVRKEVKKKRCYEKKSLG